MWRKCFFVGLLGYGFLFAGYIFAFDVPAHDAWVTDGANLFSMSEEAYLEAQLEELEQVHKAEIAVLTVDSLQGEDIAEVGYQVASERGIGKDEADNGLLILVAPNERERRIEVGYGLEGDVPDITAFQLGKQDLVPAFRQQQYFQGVTTLIEHLSGVVAGTYTPEMYTSDASETSLLGDFLLGLFVLSFLAMFVSLFTRSAIDSRKEDPEETTKKDISLIGSFINMLPGLIIVGTWGLLYLVPLYYIWKFFITNKDIVISSGTSSSGWSSGGRSSGGGSFGGGFSGFGGGSFGGGGASGGR